MSAETELDVFKFSAESHGDNWFAIGTNKAGDECWTHNGIIISDKALCERIAANMQKAYDQGLEDSAKSFVQHAIAVADAGKGRISNITSGGAYLIQRRKRV